MTVRRFPAACTIISRNYLSDARVLAESYLKHHPGARFYTLVVDNLPDEADAGAGNHVIGPDELDLPYLPELYFKCNATELCITLKPPLMRLLLDRYNEPEVIYFDSDILVMRRLDELIGALSAANILLTPHLLKPIPLDGLLPSEQDILRAGAFNLGFIAVRRSEVARDFLHWWQERMRDGCFIEASGGLLTDQRWNDLTPSLFSATSLRDETYNVAYWNLHSRPIERDGQAFLVNGRPLAFFHFSGFDPREPAVLSKHQNRTRVEKGSGLSRLLDLYAWLQKRHGFDATRQWKYGYGSFDNGATVSSPMRNVYNSLAESQRKAFGDPFRTAGDDSFFAWATRPDSASTLSPFLKSLYALRPDLAAAFPDVEGKHREAFLKWAGTDGASEFRYDPVLMRIAIACRPSAATTAIATHGAAPRCSVIIPVYNHSLLTRNCLESIFSSASAARDFEVIVADDGSTDATRELLQSYGGRIRVVSHAANAGFARSCNDAAAVAASEYLIFLNNDTTGQSGWLDALVRYADQHPEAAVVGSKLLFPNDTVQHAGMAIAEDGEPRHLYTGFPADHAAVNRSRKFQAVTGACLLIRRQDFERAKGFDSSFANGYEDVDLCLRLGDFGREIHYCHESVLYHLEAVTREVRIEDGRNRELFHKRWAKRVRSDELHYYVEDQLLKIDYRPLYPIGLSVSPLLAVINGAERECRVDRLLESRSRQVLGLLKDTIRLNVRVQEMELHSQRLQVGGSTPAHDSRAFAEPRVICRGTTQWQSDHSSGRTISIILPIKNGAAKLRDLLPAILAQQTRDQIEIIAVDSASTDESVELLKQSNATVIAIDPRSFNHGLTRNLAARYARGSIYVFLNQSTLPADEHWLANLVRPFESDPSLAGVCGRVLPRKDAGLLMAREISRNINAGTERIVTAITDWEEYRSLKPEKLRLFVNFHSLSAAMRAEVFQRIPFREANFAEDLIWGKDVLEAGYRIQYEPSSLVFHSHNYSLLDTFRRNFDDGAACASITGRQLAESDVAPGIAHLIRDDCRYLEQECGLEGPEFEQWRLASAMNRTAQIIGHWLGVNYQGTEGGLVGLLSITEQIKAGAKTENPDQWSVAHASDAG
jgi:GT2 family glycosyltransferase